MRRTHVFWKKLSTKLCACGRAGLLHLIANQAYVGMHVTEGRSLSCTFMLRYRNGYNGVVLKTIVSLVTSRFESLSQRLNCPVMSFGLTGLYPRLYRYGDGLVCKTGSIMFRVGSTPSARTIRSDIHTMHRSNYANALMASEYQKCAPLLIF